MNESFSIRCSALTKPGHVTVVAFQGVEAISTPYEITFHALAARGTTSADLHEAVGETATLEIGDDSAYALHGIIASVDIVGLAGDRPLFAATVVPRLWLLSQSLHSRAFTNQSLPDILKKVLEGAGLGSDSYRLELEHAYAPRELVVQYRESNLAFLSRWMEREGLYYFFEQGDDAEKLVITDSRATHEALSETPVRFFGLGGGRGAGECVRRLSRLRRVVPRKVEVGDYDPQHPDAELTGSADAVEGPGGIVHAHGVGVADADAASRRATVMAERFATESTRHTLEGTTRSLRSGYTFKLEEHPDDTLNAEYFVTRLVHSGVAESLPGDLRGAIDVSHDDVYRVEATAIPADQQYRAATTTPWPEVTGFEAAVVDGPADGQEPQIDEHGRYKVKLRFDESDASRGDASAWLRMIQPHAGTPEGFHFPLRKGTEVMLSFVGGDPDRPVISGAMHDAERPSVVTGDNALSNVMHTAADNHFELHDTRGKQFVALSTPTQATSLRLGSQEGEGSSEGVSLSTEGDKKEETGGDETETIHGSKIETVYGSEVVNIYGGKADLVVGGDIGMIVGGKNDTIVGVDNKNVLGGEVIVVVGLAPVATQLNLIGFDNKNILGGAVDNILGVEMGFVGGGVQEVILGLETNTVLGGTVEVVAGAVSSTVLGAESKIVLGGVVENFGGLAMKNALAGVIDTTIGVEVGFIGGVQLNTVVGAAVDLVLGAEIDLAVARFKEEGIPLGEQQVKSESAGVKLLTNSSAEIAQDALSSR